MKEQPQCFIQIHLQCQLFVYLFHFLRLKACICTSNWTLLLDYTYYAIKIMRNLATPLHALSSYTFQNIKCAYYCRATPFFYLSFSIIVCNCRSLQKQSRFLIRIPTRGRVSWKCAPPPSSLQQHHQVAYSPFSSQWLSYFTVCSFIVNETIKDIWLKMALISALKCQI